MYTIMISSKSKSFISFFLLLMALTPCFGLILIIRTVSIMLDKNGKCGVYYFILPIILRHQISHPSVYYCKLFVDGPYYWETFYLITMYEHFHFSNLCWDLSNAFFYISWNFHVFSYSINIVNYDANWRLKQFALVDQLYYWLMVELPW